LCPEAEPHPPTSDAERRRRPRMSWGAQPDGSDARRGLVERVEYALALAFLPFSHRITPADSSDWLSGVHLWQVSPGRSAYCQPRPGGKDVALPKSDRAQHDTGANAGRSQLAPPSTTRWRICWPSTQRAPPPRPAPWYTPSSHRYMAFSTTDSTSTLRLPPRSAFCFRALHFPAPHER